MAGTSKRELGFAILEVLADTDKEHKHNLLGRPYQCGRLERYVGTKFTSEERALAGEAFELLRRDGLIEPTYSDLADPDNWVEITEAGRAAVNSRAFDDLDQALNSIDEHLVEIRAGAWAAARSAQPDALRQAAHSGRELIDQTLKAVAPDEEVREQDWFQPNTSSQSDVTRRHRLKLAIQKRRGRVSKSDLKLAETACDFALAVNNDLMAQSHARATPPQSDVVSALKAAEVALRRLLL